MCVEQHGIPVGEKAVQTAKFSEREASEDKDPRRPLDGMTPE